MKEQALVSWSGGKDSCYAAMLAIENGFEIKTLLNVLNEEGKISRSHGIPSAILQAQADALQLPIHLISSSWNEYEAKFVKALRELQQAHQLTSAVFGDIDLQAHRDWEEMVCAKAQLQAYLPLWKQDRKHLVYAMIDAGIETMIVSCNSVMGEKFIGRQITKELVEELEGIGVDACGENGEYHTLVTNCPLFKSRLLVNTVATLQHENFWFSQLELK
jgi:diphthine-ammonia ligase